MAVFRIERTKDFTVMSKHQLQTTEISNKEKSIPHI